MIGGLAAGRRPLSDAPVYLPALALIPLKAFLALSPLVVAQFFLMLLVAEQDALALVSILCGLLA
jgi:hypothetical protein